MALTSDACPAHFVRVNFTRNSIESLNYLGSSRERMKCANLRPPHASLSHRKLKIPPMICLRHTIISSSQCLFIGPHGAQRDGVWAARCCLTGIGNDHSNSVSWSYSERLHRNGRHATSAGAEIPVAWTGFHEFGLQEPDHLWWQCSPLLMSRPCLRVAGDGR